MNTRMTYGGNGQLGGERHVLERNKLVKKLLSSVNEG